MLWGLTRRAVTLFVFIAKLCLIFFNFWKGSLPNIRLLYFYCNSLLFEQLWLVSRKVLLVLRQAIIRVIRPACTQARFHIYYIAESFLVNWPWAFITRGFRRFWLLTHQTYAKDDIIYGLVPLSHVSLISYIILSGFGQFWPFCCEFIFFTAYFLQA